MSVRTGTPARSRTARQHAQPLLEAGPAERRPDVRLALSNEALKTYGTPSAPGDVADGVREADGVRFALDDAGAGDEEQRRARRRS